MKNLNNKYLFRRSTMLFALLSAFTALLILAFTIFAVREHFYGYLVMLAFVVFGGILYLYRQWVYRPYKETSKTLKLFAKGYVLQGIFDLRCPFSPEMENAILKFKDMLNTKELFNVSKKQAEYLALQNQINPHFLYNTLEGIRGEALTAGMTSIAEMTEALATFFRYTISNVENLVTLEDELTNIENYYIIQQYRFGDRLNLSIEFDHEDTPNIMEYRLPKLTLQPIIENSIYHGLERKMGKGNLKIKVDTTPTRLIIIVSDDGLGMDEKRLEALNKKLNITSLDYVKPDTEKKGGIAIMNVNNRIKLLFGEEYGIYIYSTLNLGTDVEITLPLISDAVEVN
ncbi:histidine kinase [Oscillospiraceae bacterium PP1C4]